jgi:hypothetical protein
VAPDQGDPIPKGSPTIPAGTGPGVAASDVHCFLELLRLASSAARDQAIAGLGGRARPVRGRPGADVPLWLWLYDGPNVAGECRAEYPVTDPFAETKRTISRPLAA